MIDPRLASTDAKTGVGPGVGSPANGLSALMCACAECVLVRMRSDNGVGVLGTGGPTPVLASPDATVPLQGRRQAQERSASGNHTTQAPLSAVRRAEPPAIGSPARVGATPDGATGSSRARTARCRRRLRPCPSPCPWPCRHRWAWRPRQPGALEPAWHAAPGRRPLACRSRPWYGRGTWAASP